MTHILKLGDVQRGMGLSRVELMEGVRTGTIPRPKRRGARIVGWPEAVIRPYFTGKSQASYYTTKDRVAIPNPNVGTNQNLDFGAPGAERAQ
jgi:predicted DNA-binding transcriptional regulator AlpA